MAFFKQLFCKHSFVIRTTNFPKGYTIDSKFTRGMTSNRARFWTIRDDYYSHGDICPSTNILTFHKVNGYTVTLYCKECTLCGKMVPADAFDVEKAESEHSILQSAGL